MYKYKLKRRSFIKSSALSATGIFIGFTFDPQKSIATETFNKEIAISTSSLLLVLSQLFALNTSLLIKIL